MCIQYFTGTNSRLFMQSFILLQSLAEAGAAGLARICDFGLSEIQRRFLAERGLLATADPPVPEHLGHFWHYKAALGNFRRGEGALVWIDVDMLLTGDPRPAVETLAKEMEAAGELLAAVPDAERLSLAGFVERFDVAPFARLLAGFGIAPDHPYLNSGFFVARSGRWLERWRDIAFGEKSDHLLFEQNAFNLAAWEAPAAVRLLDARHWNVHGKALTRVARTDDGIWRCGGEPILVLHATSVADQLHEAILTGWRVLGREETGVLKLFRDPALRALQLRLLQSFAEQTEGDFVPHL